MIKYRFEIEKGHARLSGERKRLAKRGPGVGSDGGLDEDWPSTLGLLLRLTGIGWYVAVAIALGAVGGWWLDGRLGTGPALTLLGIALGLVVALTGMIRMLRAVYRASDQGRGGGTGRTDGRS